MIIKWRKVDIYKSDVHAIIFIGSWRLSLVKCVIYKKKRTIHYYWLILNLIINLDTGAISGGKKQATRYSICLKSSNKEKLGAPWGDFEGWNINYIAQRKWAGERLQRASTHLLIIYCRWAWPHPPPPASFLSLP